MASKRRKSISGLKEVNPNILLMGGLAAVLIFGTKSILKMLGFDGGKDEAASMAALQAAGKEDYFNPNYYKKVNGAKILTVAAAQMLSKKIYDSKGFFNDDEAQLYSAFQSLTYKTQVSFLAEQFARIYNKSLYGYLDSFLNVRELGNVATICNKLK